MPVLFPAVGDPNFKPVSVIVTVKPLAIVPPEVVMTIDEGPGLLTGVKLIPSTETVPLGGALAAKNPGG